MRKTQLTLEYVRRTLDYNLYTGDLIWRERTPDMFEAETSSKAIQACKAWNTKYSGRMVGRLGKDGYLYLTIKGERHLAHRVIWLYQTGEYPPNLVDHIDTNKSNNTWANLREATHSTNGFNRGRQRNNTSGFKGVCFDKRTFRWKASIYIDKKIKNLGRFPSKEAAHTAYCEAAKRFHGEYARTK